MIIPKTQADYDLWKTIVALPKGQKAASVDTQLKFKLKQLFAVEQDKLIAIKSRKEVVIAENLPSLLKEHHDNKSHPGRDATYASLKSAYAGVPVAIVSKYVAECLVCMQKTTIPKAPVGKPIKSTGVWHRVWIDLIVQQGRWRL